MELFCLIGKLDGKAQWPGKNEILVHVFSLK